MATRFTFIDDSGDVRLSGFLDPEPAGTFNGGTITQPLTVNSPVATLLDLVNSPTLSNWEVDVFQSDQGGGVVNAELAMRGEGAGTAFVRLRNGTGDSSAHVGSDQITLDSNSNTATDSLFELSSVFWGTLLEVFADHTQVGAPMKYSFPPTLQNHSAPADGTLAAGDCALWFDQTNGSPALNIKGKQADGTVFSGIVTRLAQVSPKGVITSGALSTVQLVTATGAQILTTRDAETITPCTFNPGAATTATVTVAISPDNATYSTLGVETVPAGVALDGTIHLVKARVPAGWYLKLTVNAQATLGLTTYY